MIEFGDRPVPEKLIIQSFLSFVRKTCVALGTGETGNKNRCVAARNAWDHNRLFCVLNGKKKKGLQIMTLDAYASETNNRNLEVNPLFNV